MEHDHLHPDHAGVRSLGAPHDDDPAAAPDPGPEPKDAAQRSLADALQLSFRLLSAIMLVVLAALLVTGMTQIPPDKVGVRLLFGRIVGEGESRVLREGLHWSVPEPMGRVVKVSTAQQKLDVNDFWFHERPEDATKSLREVQAPPEGLRPGWDGALLTGDRGLMHVKFTVLYGIRTREGAPEAEAVIDYLTHFRDPDEPSRGDDVRSGTVLEAVRSAVCNAAIAEAGARTIDSIYPTGQKDFADAVQERAQHRLNQLRCGLQIHGLLVPISTVPLAAIPAFDAVTSARQDLEQNRNRALGEAASILNSAAGTRSYVKLVGDPRSPGDQGGDPKRDTSRLGTPLIRQYDDRLRRNDLAGADAILKEIDRILIDESEGAVAEIISSAEGYSSSIQQQVQGRLALFQQLQEAFRSTPELLLQRHWTSVKQEILGGDTNEKYYLTPGQKTVLKINQDPSVTRRILQEQVRTREAEVQRKSSPGR